MSAKLKPWLVLAVIFVAGILTGVALTIAFHAHFARPLEPRDVRKHWMELLTERLKLTSDQQTKIQPILADADTKIRALHHEEAEQGSQIFKATDDQIAALLTPDQKVELQKMEAEREKMFSGHMRPWGGQGGMFHHEGGGDVPPPPPGGSPPTEPPASSAPAETPAAKP